MVPPWYEDMTRIGKPEENPEIVIEPIENPVPEKRPAPVEVPELVPA